MTLHDSSLPSGCPDALEVSRVAAAAPRLPRIGQYAELRSCQSAKVCDV